MKVSRTVGKAENHLHGQFFGICQILWRIIMESSNLNTSWIRDEWYSWESSTQNLRRNFCCAIRLGWKMVGLFNGLLQLSAKCSRPPGRWENTVWKAIRRTILKDQWSRLVPWLNIIRFLHEASQGFINMARKSCQVFSSDVHQIAREICKGDILVADIEAGKFRHVRNPCSKTHCKGS